MTTSTGCREPGRYLRSTGTLHLMKCLPYSLSPTQNFLTHIPEGPDALTAPQYTDLRRFEECTGGRHKIPADEALEAIIPNSEDQMEFRKNAILHVAHILGDEVKIFADFLLDLPKIEDPRAMPARKTEEYYLPTFDQEQGS